MLLGKFVQQPKGFKAYIPDTFPPKSRIDFNPEIQLLVSDATLALGKLDGVAQLIPDIDFFIYMYVRKEATFQVILKELKLQCTTH